MSIIDSLSAGYRLTGRRMTLLAIPILLDLMLWATPRLSVEPIIERFIDLYRQATLVEGATPAELETLVEQMSTTLTTAASQSNLLDFLVSESLYHVPSALTLAGILPGVSIVQVENPLVAVGLSLLVGLVGLFMGVLYMGMLAQTMPIGLGEKAANWLHFLQLSIRRWLRTIAFVLLTILALILLYIPATIGITLVALISASFGSIILMLVSAFTFMLFFYLYFVTAGLILDDQTIFEAVTTSFSLVRNSFWSALGFILLTNVISAGFGLLINPLSAYTPVGTAIAILANAYIGTGLVMALLIYYRTQLLGIAGASTLAQSIAEIKGMEE